MCARVEVLFVVVLLEYIMYFKRGKAARAERSSAPAGRALGVCWVVGWVVVIVLRPKRTWYTVF